MRNFDCICRDILQDQTISVSKIQVLFSWICNLQSNSTMWDFKKTWLKSCCGKPTVFWKNAANAPCTSPPSTQNSFGNKNSSGFCFFFLNQREKKNTLKCLFYKADIWAEENDSVFLFKTCECFCISLLYFLCCILQLRIHELVKSATKWCVIETSLNWGYSFQCH